MLANGAGIGLLGSLPSHKCMNLAGFMRFDVLKMCELLFVYCTYME